MYTTTRGTATILDAKLPKVQIFGDPFVPDYATLESSFTTETSS